MLINTIRYAPLVIKKMAAGYRLRRRPLELGLGIWVALLMALPVVIARNISPAVLNTIYIEPKAHALIEAFCGFVACLIACLITAVAMRRRERGLWLFSIAFFAMAILDTIHAFTNPMHAREAFVAFHTSSTLAGSIFITLGLLQQVMRGPRLTAKDFITIAGGLALMSAMAVLYRSALPWFAGHEQLGIYQFSGFAHSVHGLAALLYSFSALLLYQLYRNNGQMLMLVVGSFLVLFAQSALLFSFSKMWDFPWWLWHGAKVMFYLGILISISVGFLLALDGMRRSQATILRANARIKRSQRKIQKVNRELHSRNRMVSEAIGVLDVPHAIEVLSHAVREQVEFNAYELVLLVPEDRVAELARSAQFVGARHLIRVEAEHNTSQLTNTRTDELVWLCVDATSHASWICLDLVAHGKRFGYMRFLGVSPETFAASHPELSILASEAAPIIDNALLYLERQQEGAFRAALLRVSTMLTSTLDLSTVLAAVCRESAALLDADGATVWLPTPDGEGFSRAARWFMTDQTDPSCEQAEAWCQDGRLCTQLLAKINGQFHPRAWIVGSEGAMDILHADPKRDKAVGLFPLIDEDCLIGVMMLVRDAMVPFSEITLSKGELLAGQVRIAISNASSYRKLSEINQQLLLAEATKIRNERLAALGQMAASVAHEVRNPLSAIANCVSVLKAGYWSGSKADQALEIIEDGVLRLDNLTRDFLTFGKPRPAMLGPVTVDVLLHKVCGALEHHIAREELPIQIEVAIRNAPCVVMMDAGGLEMVLWNLLLNAVQAIPGRGRIKASLSFRPHYLFFAITDTGKGISMKERERIFEPFYSQRSHGAGLGLAIVQRFVQDWQGRIRILSAPGYGTSFILMIPKPRHPESDMPIEYPIDYANIAGR